MGMPAARISDMHTCPMVTVLVPHVGGPIITGMWTVLTGGMPQARVTDLAACVGPPDMIIKGAFTVLVGGMPAARIGDNTVHGGVIITGWPTVLIGDAGAAGGGGAAGAGAGAAAVPGLPPNENLALALSLIKAGGTGDAGDVRLVALELAKLPKSTLEEMQRNGTKVVACRGSVTDYRTDLKGVQPRGWPPGATWDSVPGANTPDKNEVVIAVIGHGTDAGPHVPKTGEGHGSANLTVHESMHSIDSNRNPSPSQSDDFKKARDADQAQIPPYENQPGAAGLEEAYAESAARHAEGQDGGTPNLKKYWDDQ